MQPLTNAEFVTALFCMREVEAVDLFPLKPKVSSNVELTSEIEDNDSSSSCRLQALSRFVLEFLGDTG